MTKLVMYPALRTCYLSELQQITVTSVKAFVSSVRFPVGKYHVMEKVENPEGISLGRSVGR